MANHISEKDTIKITEKVGKSYDEQMAEVSLSSAMLNTNTARIYASYAMGEIDITAAVSVTTEKVNRVNAGDINGLEETLTAQVSALDSIFNELARRAALNMGSHLNATESYLRLALKAQAQCSRAIEVLAAIKNPPVIFAKQANISHGHQQVNNSNDSHAGKIVNQQNELLSNHSGEDANLHLFER